MRVYVQSEGCSANFSEGEQIKGILSKKHELTDRDSAEVIVLNICTVKGDSRALKEIREALGHNFKRIVISGCVTEKIMKETEHERVSIVTTKNIDRIEEALENRTVLKDERKIVKLGLPRKRDNKTIGIVQIASGCLDNCAYCSTKQTKGTLYSFPEEQILEEVKRTVEEGCKEIWITAQDTACYGFDKGTDIAELLEKIAEIPGEFQVRVGMGNPRHLKKYKKRLIQAMKHPKIFKFMHLPVQSGSNAVLRRMQRGHSADDYEQLVNELREEIPDMTISTDIIVGYPGETEKEFEESTALIERTRPDVLNISRFAARPGTKAAEMDGQINGGASKERSRKLTKIFEHIAHEQNKRWEGWEGEIIIDEKGKKGTMTGRNNAYKTVVVEGEHEIGTRMKVRIKEAHMYYLEGSLKHNHV